MTETLVSARRALEAGELSALELLEEQLARARTAERLGAFITLAEEPAREQARRADAARAGGEARGALLGIPFTAKDIVDSAGLRTTSGSKIRAERVPARDAPVLGSLLGAGGVLLGKTNLHEFAFGVTNVNPHYGPARNPWSPELDRVSGGSSGGSAVALACGAGLGSIGTDTGGSIRIPAALCGIVGLKPTYGAVPAEGVTPLSWSLDHVGPMARTAADASVLFDQMTGRSTFDGLETAYRDASLVVHEDYFFDDLAPEVEAAVRRAIGALSDLGLATRRASIPEIELQASCRNAIAFAEAASYHEVDVRERPSDYGPDTLVLLRVGGLVPATDYVSALRVRRRIVRAFFEELGRDEVFVTPATVAAAPRIGDEVLDNGEDVRSGLLRMASPFNTTGFPALSVPCGRTEDGRPIGLQLAARPGREDLLLSLACAYERESGFACRPPVI